MDEPSPTTFDLVLATVDRTAELARFLDSLEAQTHPRFRLIVVDQNSDERITSVLAGREIDVLHLRSERGLSRARNVGLEHVEADVVAFPDDDCVYPPDLLDRVAARLKTEPSLGGLTGRAVSRDGSSTPSWKQDAAVLTDDNLWNRAISYTIFLRRRVVEQVGRFDEELGLGSGNPWSSGEEIEYLVRAVRLGARIAYDPALTVAHELSRLGDVEARAIAYRDGASVGYILNKHRYPFRTRARMLLRPVGGAVVTAARLNRSGLTLHAAALRGRIRGSVS